MNHHIRRGYTMLVRAVQLALAHPIENDLAASLLAELQLGIAGIEQTFGLQRHGQAAMLGAASNRQDHADALREIMRDLARIARVLDPREYPDIAHQMRTANLKVYSELLARAQCFIDAARPIEAVFVAYGAPADFLARMESQIAAVNAAEYRKFGGKGEWINATTTLTAQTREAIRTLRKLQVIHANYYRHQPGLAAAWKAATHIERASNRSAQSNAPVSAPDGPELREEVGHPASAHEAEPPNTPRLLENAPRSPAPTSASGYSFRSR
jgi:hypothetical protein